MATGASTADLMVLLVDAGKGVLTQTRRHSHIASLLQIPHVIVAVNKMDLVDFDEVVYQKTCMDLQAMMASLGFESTQFIPVSALHGDNLVGKSQRMKWYRGISLLQALEDTPALGLVEKGPFRLPIQTVVCSGGTRYYAGQLASGSLRTGQELVVMSSSRKVHVDSIRIGAQLVSEALTPSSVSVCLTEQVEMGRGDMLADKESIPTAAQRIRATMIWLANRPLALNGRYLIKHTSKTVGGSVTALHGRVDIDTFRTVQATDMQLNDIGDVEVDLRQPIFCDSYSSNRRTGSFILVDPADNSTAAAGMISHIYQDAPSDKAGRQRRGSYRMVHRS